jgi:hypothetical protein
VPPEVIAVRLTVALTIGVKGRRVKLVESGRGPIVPKMSEIGKALALFTSVPRFQLVSSMRRELNSS